MLLAVDNVKSISQLLTLLVIFAFVLAITYFTTKYVANYQKERCLTVILSFLKLRDLVRTNIYN